MTSNLDLAAHWDRITNDLSYRYDGVFSHEAIRRAVTTARADLEPIARFPDYLPVSSMLSFDSRAGARHCLTSRPATRPLPEVSPRQKTAGGTGS